MRHFVSLNPVTCSRSVALCWWLLIAAGVGLRLAASVFSQGFVYPDEHQQYLEVAQGIVYGPWVKFWEHERGVRNYFYPGCLALLLWMLEKVGINDPVQQATAIRALMGIAVFASIALLARDWLRQGQTAAAFCLLSLAALSPDVIYMSIRTLSESAVIIPVALGLFFFGRRPFVTGFLLGAMFAVRFQTAFFILGFFALSLYVDWKGGKWRHGSTWKMAASSIFSLLVLGLIDRLTWGSWFHSPVEYFRAQIIEGIAASFGTSPWNKHLEWAAFLFAEAVPLFGFILLALGLFHERRLALVALLFLLGHSAIGHKEYRFLWPILPIGLLVFSAGFEAAYKFLPGRSSKAAFLVLLACCLVKGSWSRFRCLDWNPEPARSSSVALANIGHREDVTGVAVLNVDAAECGNHFYLRRDVPLLFRYSDDLSTLTSHPHWTEGKINYVIAWPADPDLVEALHLEEVEIVHGLGIYKRAMSTATAGRRGTR